MRYLEFKYHDKKDYISALCQHHLAQEVFGKPSTTMFKIQTTIIYLCWTMTKESTLPLPLHKRFSCQIANSSYFNINALIGKHIYSRLQL